MELVSDCDVPLLSLREINEPAIPTAPETIPPTAILAPPVNGASAAPTSVAAAATPLTALAAAFSCETL